MYEFLLVAGVVLWAGLLIWYLRHPVASAYHPATFYFVFHGVLFVLRPILAHVQSFGGIYAVYQFTPSLADKVTVLLAADLALVMFVLLSVRIGNVAFTRAPGTGLREAEPRLTLAFWLTLAICLPLPLFVMTSSFGAQGTMMLDQATGIVINTTGNGYFNDSVLMLGSLAVLFAWAGRFRWWALLPLVLFVLAKAGTGGRWPFVMAAMSVGLWWMYERRLRWYPPRVLASLVLLFALFTMIGADRGAALRSIVSGEETTYIASDYFAERPLEPMDYANMEFFEYIVHAVPQKTGRFDLFVNNLQIFTEPVPRVLWAGKPIGAPVKRFNLFDHGYPIGMTYSIAGAGWMQAGWFGVVVWTALFALLYGLGYRLFVQSDQSRIKAAAFFILTPLALQTFRDGILLTILKTSFFPLIPVFVWWGTSRLLAEPCPVGAPRAMPG